MSEEDCSRYGEGMSEKVDALFAGEPPAPPREAVSKLRAIRVLLMVALPMDLLGVLCWTGVPGAALTLWAWLQADGEMARVEAGEYSSEDAASLMRLRTLSGWLLGFCIVSLMAQAYLLTTSFYSMLFSLLL
ncbi:MAG: hypothetical protein ACI8S6_001622 [Myxococcota bacterium]